jgi:hypothetical protein
MLFVLGLRFSIPLSIFTNLVTPEVESWLGRVSATIARRRAPETKAEVERIRTLRADGGAFYAMLLNALIRVGLVGAVFGVVSGFFFTAGTLAGAFDLGVAGVDTFVSVSVSFGQVLSIIGALVVIRILTGAVVDTQRVRNFHAFERPTRELLRE